MGQERLLEHMRHTSSFVYTGGTKTRRSSTMTPSPASPDASLCIVKLLVGFGLSLMKGKRERNQAGDQHPSRFSLSVFQPFVSLPFRQILDCQAFQGPPLRTLDSHPQPPLCGKAHHGRWSPKVPSVPGPISPRRCLWKTSTLSSRTARNLKRPPRIGGKLRCERGVKGHRELSVSPALEVGQQLGMKPSTS